MLNLTLKAEVSFSHISFGATSQIRHDVCATRGILPIGRVDRMRPLQGLAVPGRRGPVQLGQLLSIFVTWMVKT